MSDSLTAALIANLPGVAYRCANDRDWTTEYISEGVLGLTGHTAEEFISRAVIFNDIVHPEDREMVWETIQAAVERDAQYQLTYRIVNAAGDLRWVWEQGRGVVDDAGRVALEGFITDVTDRMAVEQDLREAKYRLEGLVASMTEGLTELDARGVHVNVNAAFTAMTGFSREELIGCGPPHPYWPPEEFAAIDDALRRALAGETPEVELTFMRKSGERFPVVVSPFVIRDAAGSVVTLSATFRDITAQRSAEAATRLRVGESEVLAEAGLALIGCRTRDEVFDVISRYLALIAPGAVTLLNRCAHDAYHVVVHSVTGMDSSMLARAASMIGFDVVGATAIIAEKDLARTFVRSLQKFDGGFEAYVAGYLPRAVARIAKRTLGFHDVHIIGITDGSTVFGNITFLTRDPHAVLPARTIDSLVQMAFLTLAKIRSSRELAESEERNRLLIENMSQGLALHEVILDAHGVPCDYRFLQVNPAFGAITGLPGSDIIGLTVLEVLPGLDPSWIERYGAVALTGAPAYFEDYSPELGKFFEVVAYSPRANQFATIVADITERKAAERELRESEERYRVLTEGMEDVVWILDPETLRFTYVSPSVTRLRGFTPEEVMAESLDAALDAGGSEYARGLLAGRLADRRADRIGDDTFFTEELEQPRKDGSLVWTEVVTSYHRDERTGRVEIRGVTRDISERKAAEVELAAYRQHLEALVEDRTANLAAANEDLMLANEELRVATAAKSDFLAAMSHELRTPMNSIIGFSGILSQGLAGPLTDEQRVQLGMVNRSGRHLLSLIDDVLDLSKIEAGRATPVVEPVDVQMLVHDVAEAVRPLATAKGLYLEVGEAAFEGPLRSDEGKLRQILFNLVGNAVKFTERGGIRVAVRGGSAGACEITVTDTGCGIDARDLQRIFEPFTQLDSPALAKPRGTGLGLRISQEYAHLLGGRITVVSEVGVGSTFMLRLPIGPPSYHSVA